jgi:hypothetical protein
MITARTTDKPQPTHTTDGRPILYTLEPGDYAFWTLDDGRVSVVPARGTGSTREQQEAQNVAALRRMQAAAGSRVR